MGFGNGQEKNSRFEIYRKLQNERIEYNSNRGTSPVGPAMTGLTFEISRILNFFKKCVYSNKAISSNREKRQIATAAFNLRT